MAFSIIGSSCIARNVLGSCRQVDVERMYAIFNRGCCVIGEIVACYLLECASVIEFFCCVKISERRVVRIFFLKDCFATFRIVARVIIGIHVSVRSRARVAAGALRNVASIFFAIGSSVYLAIGGALVIFFIKRVVWVDKLFPKTVYASAHDGVVINVVIAFEVAVSAFPADRLVGAARNASAKSQSLFGFASDTFKNRSVAFVVIDASVSVIGAFPAGAVTLVTRIFSAAFCYLFPVFATGDSCLKIFVFGAGRCVVEAFTAVGPFFVARYRIARAVDKYSFGAFLDDADSRWAVGTGTFKAFVAVDFCG